MSNEKSTKYSMAPGVFSTSKQADETTVRNTCLYMSDEKLEKWGTDPNCLEMEICAKILAERRAGQIAAREERRNNPFDPRTEVSADAKHIAGRIVMHLWILFVLLPFIIGVLWEVIK